MIKFLAPSLKL